MIALVLILPLLLAIAAIALFKEENAKRLALIGSLASLVLFPLADTSPSTLNWLTIQGVVITVTTSITPLNYILLLLVCAIAPLIFAYSFDYMDLPSEQKRFYTEMLAFEAAMLAFAMAGDFILLFIAWEFLSFTSYMLIGFWHSRERALAAARKAITIVLIGDVALLAAIVIIQNTFGTLVFSSLVSGASQTGFPATAAALLVIAIATKSAQFPFHEWLADAMEGPTPVSAFLHSTTMVKAGVFAAIILFPLFSAAQMLSVFLVMGAITAVVALLNASREQHIKRVLAYSTAQELGLMIFAVGSNALLAAVYLFFAQSFYKALLFFSSGVMMKANDSEKLEEISGINQNRWIYLSTLFGVLALAGFVPFDGFFANAGLGSAFATNLLAYAFISAITLGTSFYIFRWFFLQNKRSVNQRASVRLKAASGMTLFVMLLLALATLAASAAFFVVPAMLSRISYVAAGSQLGIGTLDAVVETVLALAGAYMGYSLYAQRKKSPAKAEDRAELFEMFHTSRLVNAAYVHFTGFVEALAEAVAYVDYEVNAWFDSWGHDVIVASGWARRLATGSINSYAAIFVAGMLLLVLLLFVI